LQLNYFSLQQHSWASINFWTFRWNYYCWWKFMVFGNYYIN